VPLPSGTPRRVTNDLLEYRIVSLTADGSSLVTVAADVTASVWTAPLDGREPPRRVTSSRFDGIYGVAFAPDGRVVYSTAEAGNREALWIASADAGDRSPLPTGEGEVRSPVVTRSGQLFYVARTAASTEIRRLALDGQAPSVVVSGVSDSFFAVSPDARVVVFGALREGQSRLFRVDADGGEPVAITEGLAFAPAFSPDGRRLAYYTYDPAGQRFCAAIAPAAGGPPERLIDVEVPGASSRILFGEEGLYLNSVPGDRANVWLLPLDGRPARRLTGFDDDNIFSFALSPDGKTLAYSRGPRTRDAMLVRGFR
jgi:TolB protein